MKKFLPNSKFSFLLVMLCLLFTSKTSAQTGQLVINEVYTDPNAGKNEFIEFYNMSSQPESVDNYTLVTYFKSTLEEGFYVLDFPDLIVEPKGFFVGASAFPFNYQSNNNSLNANFNWNNLGGLTNTSLKKWVRSSINILDGNLYYDQAILPVGFNDLFNRLTGDNSFTFLLYKNGVLVNQIIAGAGGSSSISNTILSMPALNVTMSGTAPDFNIDFSKYATLPVEKITQDGGTDNGFIRTIDGGCNTWTKSSSSSNHTPMRSNGTMTTGTAGAVTITSNIIKGTYETGSTLSFTVTGGNSSAFPVELRIFTDNGTVPGQHDINDPQIATKYATATGQSFTLNFKPFDTDIFIVVKQGSGCIDGIQMAKQSSAIPLPVKYTSFTAALVDQYAALNWQTADEINFSHFILQKSTDGKNFQDIATIFSNEGGSGTYSYKDKQLTGSPIFYYRLKGVDYNGTLSMSQVRIIRLATQATLSLTAFPNPAKELLQITLPATWQGKKVNLQLVNSTGMVLQHININNASQVEMLHIGNHAKGIYLLQATCDQEKLQSRIIKQ